jgi:hypothetical protein
LETLAKPLESSTRSLDPVPEVDAVELASRSVFCVSWDRPDSVAADPVKSLS